jgi:predicted Fe-S protein YdhL (DUF1289 family)
MENPFLKIDTLSPCIKLCKVDSNEHYCIGCNRSLSEISNWWKYSEDEKRKVLEELKTRILPSDGISETEPE